MRVSDDVGNCCDETTGDVEGKITTMPHCVLHIVAEQVEKPHVAQKVHPTAVQKHRCKRSEKQFERHNRFAPPKRRVFGGHDRDEADKLV